MGEDYKKSMEEGDKDRVQDQACSGTRVKDVYAGLHGYVLQENEDGSWEDGTEKWLLKKKISCHSQLIAKWEVLSHQACHEWEKSPEQFMILAREKV